ncbi:hypothetical protein BDV3_004461 [Batrachochytrium dendrobatidis]|uniref:TATA-binding protein-associated factor mot1 n=1 Tax=Batrachochytrium dendrobatidis (strain JEL423) TaxID=403673 RepID=A0A177WH81_BATDL|nr:hypothetical protein BDEG_22921 [Batrachochytrium dendrobatidis JEL423]
MAEAVLADYNHQLMATRLDRLVLLLDTGSTASVRSTAAKQLGQVQKQHPDDLYYLLSRILVYLRSKSWETRVAAGDAINAVASAVPQWDPPSPTAHSTSEASAESAVAATDLEELLLGFNNFDITTVVDRGAVLVASSGGEFDVDLSGMDPKERLVFQKKQLRERLGLATQFMDVSFVEETDLGGQSHSTAQTETKLSITQVVEASTKIKQNPDDTQASDPYAGLSARERNRLKRKAKMVAKSGGKDSSQMMDISSSLLKKRRIGDSGPSVKMEEDSGLGSSTFQDAPDLSTTTNAQTDTTGKVIVEHKGVDAATLGVHSFGDEWPFEGLCEQLSLDLFSPVWEFRHGAAIGLRELLKAHGMGLGRIAGLSRAANAARHRSWTEDLAIRLLCVLALDRFADFVGDQAVLPVRETCAQTLGALMQYADSDLCLLVVNKGFVPLIGESFVRMDDSNTALTSISNGQWEVRHSALIGLKFWMAVRKDLLDKVLVSANRETELSPVYAAILNGLKDHNDEVRAVASSALIPVSDLVVSLLPIETVFHTLVMSLWDSLHELDDLTSATSHVMDLLSNLVSKPQIAAIMRKEAGNFFQSLVPQLFPFFRHAITSVRLAVLRTFTTLVELSEQDTLSSSINWISTDLLQLVYQNFVLEENTKCVDMSLALWIRMARLILRQFNGDAASVELVMGVVGVLPNLFALLMTPIGTPLDQQLFVQFTSSNNQKRMPSESATTVASKGASVKNKKNHKVNAAEQAASQQLSASRANAPNISLHDRSMLQQDVTVVSSDAILYGRIAGATAIGAMLHTLCKVSLPNIHAKCDELLTGYIGSAWAAHRIFGSIVVQEWAGEWRLQNPTDLSPLASQPLAVRLCEMLNKQLIDANSGTSLLYLELIPSLSVVWQECLILFRIARDSGLGIVPPLPPLPSNTNNSYTGQQQQYIQANGPLGPVFTLQVCDYILQTLYPMFIQSVTDTAPLVERHMHIQNALGLFKGAQTKHETQVLAAMASAVVSLGQLPPKLNPIIRALMNSVKMEENVQMQRRGAESVAKMIQLNIIASGTGSEQGKSSGIVDKIVKNLCVFLCSDPDTVGESKVLRDRDGILSLVRQYGNKDGESSGNIGKSTAGPGRGRKKKLAGGASTETSETMDIAAASAIAEAAKATEDAAQRHSRMVVCRGAEAALEGLCKCFGADVLTALPKLWEFVSVSLTFTQSHPHTAQVATFELDPDDPQTQPLLDSMHILSVIVKYTHVAVNQQLLKLAIPVSHCLRASLSLCRYLAAKCIASLCRVIGVEAIKVLLDKVLPFSNDLTNELNRQGAVECIHHVVYNMQDHVLPYLVFLIVPLLGRMSDPSEPVRFISTNVFAQLVKLAPLESGVPDTEGFTPEMTQNKLVERKFIGQLIGTEKVADFDLPVNILAELREYQKEGVSWLAFLNRYGLHGILCDDMGLGKTLQSICMIAADHHHRAEKFKLAKSPDVAHCPSLIVCPVSLTGHWFFEIKKYAPFLKSFMYTGDKAERGRLRQILAKDVLKAKQDLAKNSSSKDDGSHASGYIDVVITSYEIVRSDIDDLLAQGFQFNYLVLDEGHVIKNPNSKLTKSIKLLPALHRLILSGTPIQNNVLELWSLFDFLMPGFLGTEQQFNDRFGKPILASRDAKASNRDQERGSLALEALHKQVLPFLMRRMKEDVLDDLPPKIIQDYYCDLGDIQQMLYDEFSHSKVRDSVANDLESETKNPKGKSGGGGVVHQHVFQALQYLRKVCNHPSLVLTKDHPQYPKVAAKLKAEGRSINDVENSPKIMALQQLLKDCGIGMTNASNHSEGSSSMVLTDSVAGTSATSPHRVLIFAQVKPMLDIIENDLFKKHMPSVTYMRLDGTTDGIKRHELVTKFNQDPSIDVLLLTTHVGGLGLNLTGADTVIFVEHDWNPMKDLQAMDRVHRIGQKRVVNVYRLITRGTLEEKIMGLQKFKLNLASSVINQENTGIASMDTSQILDLFSLDADAKGGRGDTYGKAGDAGSGPVSAKKAIENLEGLWDESQYDDMHVDEFLKGLQSN